MPRKPATPSIETRRHTCADGSVTETFSVRWFDLGGKRRRATFPSFDEAESERSRLAGIAIGRGEPTGLCTVADFWPVWLADARARVARRTADEYERIFETRIRRRFGSTRLRALASRQVALWRAALLAQGVGAESVRKAMGLLQSIFTVAVEWGEAERNPVAPVRKPRARRRRAVRPLTPLAVERLRLRLPDDQLGSPTLASVLAYGGLRPGEALALRRRHVRRSTILVEDGVSDGDLGEPKTGMRSVDLLGPLSADLELYALDRGLDDPDDLLFPRPHGGLWTTCDWNNWRKRVFHPAAAAAGLGRPRPYDLRHSFASLMIHAQCISIVELAQQLGHAPTMTLDTYAHVFAERRGEGRVDPEAWILSARAQALAERL